MRRMVGLLFTGMLAMGLQCKKPRVCDPPPPPPDPPPDLIYMVPPDTTRGFVRWLPFRPRVYGNKLFYLLGECGDRCFCAMELWKQDLPAGAPFLVWDFDSLCANMYDVGSFEGETLVVASVQEPFWFRPLPFLLLVRPGSGRVDTLSWGCDLPMVDPRFSPDGQFVFAALIPYDEADTMNAPRCTPGVWRYDRVQDTAWKVADLVDTYGFYSYRGYALDGDSVWQMPYGFFPSIDPWEGRWAVGDQVGWLHGTPQKRLLVWDREENTGVEVEIPWEDVATVRHPVWAEVPGHGRGIVFSSWEPWAEPVPDEVESPSCPAYLWGLPPGLWLLKNWERYIVR